MRRRPQKIAPVVLLASCVFAAAVAAPPVDSAQPVAPGAASAPSDSALALFRRDNLALYHDLRFDEARAAAEAIVARPGETAESRLRALSTLVAIDCSVGDEARAGKAVKAMLDIDPRALLLPPRSYASPVVQCFYEARGRVAERPRGAGTTRINTLAVGEFRNHSVLPGSEAPFDLDRFARGLGDLVRYDLAAVTDLELVDRERLDALEREIAAGEEGGAAFDDEMRVAAGRLCGAHAFLFGSVMMVDGKNVRLGVRLVATATGEVLLADRVEGRLDGGRDLIRLEEKLVRGLIGPKIDEVVEAYNGMQGAARRSMDGLFASKEEVWGKGDSRYLDFLLDSGEALRLEDQREYGAALRAWNALAREYPDDARARNRALGLRAWLHGRGRQQTEQHLPKR